MSQRIQDYLLASASAGREVVPAGPFTVTISPHDPLVYINYAIPSAGADPTPADIAALEEAFVSRSRTPRLEYLPGLAPLVEPALVAAGFTVTDRLPLMECPPGAVADLPLPPDIELVTPVTDGELRDLLTAQHEAFGEPPPGAAHLEKARTSGGVRVLARTLSGEPVGGGAAVAVKDGISEVAGIAVRPAFERRGIGAAVTAHLTRAAHAAGATLVFLTPGGDAQERVYSRVGYRRTDSVLFLTKESK
ncbi:GNAT family N-acetyltransferase [Dactylosporangium sp. NPDC006015]|uniref:GNAT family N-acetyltransferase n=1 Tax=Dactylosporangium sp. NPDC006015 TaxID=3154576 RepID=UPI0033B431C2